MRYWLKTGGAIVGMTAVVGATVAGQSVLAGGRVALSLHCTALQLLHAITAENGFVMLYNNFYSSTSISLGFDGIDVLC
jgi:hypothetical protein